jgi:CubicO group peptidase (beta-lactamase class C family)
MKVSPEYLVKKFMEESKAPGVFVAIVRGDEVLYEKGFGVADNTSRQPISAETCMELGSIGKGFTGQIIYDLAHTGHLKLSDPAAKYFPGAPASWSTITIHHLLKHSSGIQNYLLDPRFKSTNLFTAAYDLEASQFFKNVSTDSLVKMFYTMPTEFNPGESWSYSNTGYILLGEIAENVTGKPYLDIVRERLLTPLGMKHTFPNDQASQQHCLARGYFPEKEELQVASMLPWHYAFSAGAWSTTGNDMIKFMKAVHNRKMPIEKSGFDWRNFSDEMPFTYDAGSFHARFNGMKIISHNGGTPGFSSSWIYVVEKNLSIIVLCNRQDYAGIDLLARDLLSIFDFDLFCHREEIKGTEEEYYKQRLLDLITAIQNDTPYPEGISEPLRIFLETENGKGLWKWYFERGFPSRLICVGKEASGTGKTYRFWAAAPKGGEYKLTLQTNLKNRIVQFRWW